MDFRAVRTQLQVELPLPVSSDVKNMSACSADICRFASADEMHQAVYNCLISRGEACYRFVT